MSEHTRVYTIEGTKDGKPVKEDIRAFGVKDARRQARKMGIEVERVYDFYRNELWVKLHYPPAREDDDA